MHASGTSPCGEEGITTSELHCRDTTSPKKRQTAQRKKT